MSTILKLAGIVKKKLPDKSGTTKAGKPWTKKTFILTPLDGSKDLFVSTFGEFDNSLIGQTVEVDAEQFNDTSYNAKGDAVSIDGGAEEALSQTGKVPISVEANTTPKVTPKVAPKAAPKASKNGEVDPEVWARKDRAQAIGGLMHDAATLASCVNLEPTGVNLVSITEEIVLGLIKVKLKAEEALKKAQGVKGK